MGRKPRLRLGGGHFGLIHRVKLTWLGTRRALRHNVGTLRSIRRSEFHKSGSESLCTLQIELRFDRCCLLSVKHQRDGRLTSFAMWVALGKFLDGRQPLPNRVTSELPVARE